jgi:hypothetical protein
VFGVAPQRAVVIEDAISGVRADVQGGFGLVIGVARKGDAESLTAQGAHAVVNDLAEFLRASVSSTVTQRALARAARQHVPGLLLASDQQTDLCRFETSMPIALNSATSGAPLLFGRLWQETGCQAVIEDLLAGRAFEFPVARAVFASVLHRIMVSGSDRACEKWMADYDIPGVAGLAIHHLYRTMAWLGEELPAAQQAQATPFAPRTVKDLIEEQLFAHRCDLFSELSVVFLDTTSLRFAGAGGQTLGARGHSKDHRPDLMQMIVGVVIDADGRPVCSEMWQGNTADVTVLIPVIDRLRARFAIGRVCVVADRGMISAATIAALEDRTPVRKPLILKLFSHIGVQVGPNIPTARRRARCHRALTPHRGARSSSRAA